jgi:hypothetical membrane protein
MITSYANKSQKWPAIAGMLAPFLYISMIILLGLLEPGYNQRTMMSVLGGVQGWRGAIFNLGLVLIGIFLIVFGIGLFTTRLPEWEGIIQR